MSGTAEHPRRVVFLAGTLGMGGAERQLYYMLDAAKSAGAGMSVSVVSLDAGGAWEEPIRRLGLAVTVVPRDGSRLKRLVRVLQELGRHKPHLIQCQHFYTNLYGVFAARLYGAREIGAIRSDGRSELRANRGVLGRFQLHTPRLLAVNSRAAIRYLQTVGVKDSCLFWLPNVVDTQHFCPLARRRVGRLRILGVGRHNPVKRWDRFLRAFARLKERCGSRVEAELVGDGPERTSLESLARSLGLGPEDVRFRGSSTDVAPFYREADVLLHTSDWEGTPNVILEAMASGLPIVSTRVGGIPDLVRDGEVGSLVDPQDEVGLARALVELAEREDLRLRYGASAREYTLQKHARPLLPTILRSLHARALNEGGQPPSSESTSWT